MAFDYAERISGLPDEQRLQFYEVLAHQLTVAARMVWSDHKLTAAAQVSRLKWINEVLHRVTASVYVLRLRTHEWTEGDSADDLRHYVSQEPGLARVLGWAVLKSYEIVTGHSVGAAERLAARDS